MDREAALRLYFGHEGFRPGQDALIDAILSGRDALGVMPTGGGKSVCYQLPAMLLPGLTVVISPLISLMKDQVSALKAAGIPAGYVNSTLRPDQMDTVYSRARKGEYKLLYVAPERLDTDSFLSFAKGAAIPFVAVDEAHCVSQWGQDFRPSYLKIADFIAALPGRPVVAAFTATATEEVRRDIVRLLELRDPLCTVTGFDRPNLFFDVKRSQNKMSDLIELLESRREKSGIVYCATRANVERVCEALCRKGISATRYHAGLEDGERRQNQEDFQFDRKAVMVATNAFGMGIDKSNVGYVIHYNMPKSMEAYYQEAGRAGRDGEVADCILLYSDGDVVTARFLLENSGNEELSQEEQELVRRRDEKRLEAMVEYCKTSGCLRAYILEYFGQAHNDACRSCGNCTGEYRETDITIPAQMILSCIQRVKKHLGYYVGKSTVTRILRGGKGEKIRQLRLDELTTYGLMKDYTSAQVGDMIDYLKAERYVRQDPEYATLEPTEAAGAILFGGERVSMSVRSDRSLEPGKKREKVRRKRRGTEESVDDDLFTALKTVRLRLAKEESLPAYIIFSNATLQDMAAKRPHTQEEFLSVSGVGTAKAGRYGTPFLEAIREYEATHGEGP